MPLQWSLSQRRSIIFFLFVFVFLWGRSLKLLSDVFICPCIFYGAWCCLLLSALLVLPMVLGAVGAACGARCCLWCSMLFPNMYCCFIVFGIFVCSQIVGALFCLLFTDSSGLKWDVQKISVVAFTFLQCEEYSFNSFVPGATFSYWQVKYLRFVSLIKTITFTEYSYACVC